MRDFSESNSGALAARELETAETLVPLRALFMVFFRIGLLSFGGGIAAWVHREVVVMRDWISQDEFLSGFGMSQILPGANVTNLSVFIGTRLRGARGACAALGGLICGPTVIVVLFSMVYHQLAAISVFEAIMEGITVAAIGMVARIAITGAAPLGTRPLSLAIMAAVAVAVGILQWPLVPVVAVAAPASVALSFLGRRK